MYTVKALRGVGLMGKVNRKRLGILIVSALIIMIFLGFILLLTKKDNPLPQPENGILDLQAWDP